MNIFSNCTTRTDQGNVGEARAIYEYMLQGYIVSKPLIQNCKYDLLIDNKEKVLKVQIKTVKNQNKKGYWEVFLATSGGNTRKHTRIIRTEEDYDLLFVLTGDGKCWSIPSEKIGGQHGILLGKEKYKEFLI